MRSRAGWLEKIFATRPGLVFWSASIRSKISMDAVDRNRLVHIFQAQQVGSPSKARRSSESHGIPTPAAWRNGVTGPAAQQNQRGGREVASWARVLLAGDVARSHVADLVCHCPGQIRFGLGYRIKPELTKTWPPAA